MSSPLRARTNLLRTTALSCAVVLTASGHDAARGQVVRYGVAASAQDANAVSRRVPSARTATTASLGSGSVIRPSGFLTYNAFPFSPLFGYPAVNLGFPQPLGHQIISYGSNGYVYRPVTDLGAYYDRAAAALKAANYNQVLIELDPVLQEMPDDGDSWMLEAQALLRWAPTARRPVRCTGRVQRLPQSSWGRPVVKAADYFASEAEFAARLRALEAYVRLHPREGAGHFLLGYFYGYRGKATQAESELRTALRLVTGDDELANALLAPLSATPAAAGDQEKPRPGLDEDEGPREF